MKNKLAYSLTALLLASTAAIAQTQEEPIWFVDHLEIAAGKQVTVDYNIPSSEYFVQCNQDAASYDFAVLEWKNNGTTFKAQVAQMPVLLIRNDHPALWRIGRLYQMADTTGTLTFTNPTNDEMVVSCRYSLTLD